MKVPILISYAYARKPEKQEDWLRIVNDDRVDILLDSGAFSAKASGHDIQLDEYCQFLDQWKHRVFRYLALDVVGDPKATDENLRQMVKAGYNPAPVHVLGDEKAKMDELFELSDYVALAGLKRPGKGHCSKSYVKRKMEWADGRDVHWLGYVVEKMFATYKPYSTDSASWTYGTRFGWLMLYLGNGKQARKVRFDDRHQITHDKRVRNHLHRLGFDSKAYNDLEMWRSTKANGRRSIPAAVAADSWVRYTRDIAQRYGTRVFIATALASGDIDLLQNAIDEHYDSFNPDIRPVHV